MHTHTRSNLLKCVYADFAIGPRANRYVSCLKLRIPVGVSLTCVLLTIESKPRNRVTVSQSCDFDSRVVTPGLYFTRKLTLVYRWLFLRIVVHNSIDNNSLYSLKKRKLISFARFRHSL